MEFYIDFEDMVETSPDLMAVLNADCRYLYMNKTYLTRIGFKREEIIGKSVRELSYIPDHVKDLTYRIVPLILSGQMTEPLNTEIIDADGQLMYLHFKYKVINKDTPNPLIQVVSRDITKEHTLILQNRELEETNRLLSTAVEQLTNGIVITDPNKEDNPIIYVNKGFEEMTGYTLSDVVNKNCRFLQGERTECSNIETIRRGINEREPVKTELLNYKKDGTPFWNELSISPVWNESGEISHFIGILSDVTHRKSLELELQRDLSLARNIQRHLLSEPINEPSIKFTGFYKPSTHLGGDLYKWKKLNDDLYCVLMMDVMGHGIAASLLTMSINSELLSLLRQDIIEPRQVVERLNHHIFEIFASNKNQDVQPYSTCIYLLIDTKNRTIKYVNAGHPSFVLKTTDSINCVSSTMIPIGIMEPVEVIEYEISYSNGTELILYTDGITDCLNLDLNEFLSLNPWNEPTEWLNQLDTGEETLDDLCLVHAYLD